MRRVNTLITMGVLVAGALVAAAPAFARGGMGRGKARPMYDPSTVVTVKGTIEDVKQMPGRNGGMGGTHLVVATDMGKVDVQLGPTAFLEEKGLEPAKGESIEVTGSKIDYEGVETVIARDVKVGDKSVTLRDEKGVPEWPKGKRR